MGKEHGSHQGGVWSSPMSMRAPAECDAHSDRTLYSSHAAVSTVLSNLDRLPWLQPSHVVGRFLNVTRAR